MNSIYLEAFLTRGCQILFVKLQFGWWTKVYVWKRSGPSNVILHRFCLTKGSTLNSQESHPRSLVYVSKPTRAIWRYLLSEFRALLCCCTAQCLAQCTMAGLFKFYQNIMLLFSSKTSQINVPKNGIFWL